MFNRCSVRLYLVLTTLLACSAAPAFAQFQPASLEDPATGEKYHVEAGFGLWFPSADMSFSSKGLGIDGDVIDAKADLGMEDQKFRVFDIVLRPARKHKLRLQQLPISYTQESILKRDIVYRGQRYRIGLPVNSTLSWKQTHLSYEYDFVSRNRGFGGIILNTTLTNIEETLSSPILNEYVHVKAPVPRLGGIARVYVVPNISITGEFTGMGIPQDLNLGGSGNYKDIDIYGTVNFTNNVGAKFGYRAIDVGIAIEDDTGDFKQRGLYFGVVARY